MNVEAARREYVTFCANLGTDAVSEEKAFLSLGRFVLPPCAIAVLDDREAATVEYYEWLTNVLRVRGQHEEERRRAREKEAQAGGVR